jgi:subtilase family serine protease
MRNLRSSLCHSVASTLSTAICLTAICVTTICTATLSFAEAPDRIAGAIGSGKMVVLKGHVQRRAMPQFDRGRVEPAFQLHVTLLTVPSPSQAKALTQLVAEQQDPKSPNFHKWITPPQYADRFGLSHNDVAKTSAWLKSLGFTVDRVANGRNWIVFSGTASQIESAFRTEIHRYNVNGELHFANAAPPSIPAALSGIAAGFRGMSDFGPKPMIRKAAPRARMPRPGYSDSNTGLGDFVAPNDLATIYDLTPLYSAATPIDGTGEKLAIMGQTDVYLADLVNFRSGFGLPAIYSGCTATSGVLTSCTPSSTANFQYILTGPDDPGVSTGDLSEADLDLEWSAATARGAQIIFVNTSPLDGGVFESFYYAIDNILAPVISLSYGLCEWDDGGYIEVTSGSSTVPGPDEAELVQAASEGITFINSSGDSGSAECDPPLTGPPDVNNIATGGLAVSYPASSPEVTGVGGTAIVYPTGFTSGPSGFWGTDNTANNGGTAQNPPLPETAWNDDVELAEVPQLGGTALSWQESYAVVQSGGGVSNCALQNSGGTLCVSGFPVPSWQTGLSFPTAPPTTGRYSPDVSLLASPNFPGYVYCTAEEELSTTSPYDTETTSSCAGGIASAVNGVVSGQNYVVDPSIVGGTSASAPIFAGMVTMLNQYLNTSASSPPGLGPINATLYQLAATSPSAFHQVTTGDNLVYCSGDTPSPSYEINSAYLCPGTTGSQQIFGWQASNADPTTGYNLVTGLGSVDANALFTAWSGNSTTPPVFTLGVTATSLQVTPGQTGTATITVTVTSGTAPTLTFTCSEASAPALASSGSVCTVSPATPTNAASVSLQIPTFAPTAQLRRPLGSSRGIFFAALLPGLFGIIFTAGSRKRTARGLRFLSLIVVLGFSTLWLSSCSSNSSSTHNPGTPAGSYSVSVTATTGGANPVTQSTTVTLVVQ